MWGFYNVIRTAVELRRTCPKCKRVQVVRSDQRKSIVRCKYCGNDVPVPDKRALSKGLV